MNRRALIVGVGAVAITVAALGPCSPTSTMCQRFWPLGGAVYGDVARDIVTGFLYIFDGCVWKGGDLGEFKMTDHPERLEYLMAVPRGYADAK